jgi:predicted DNA binding CopG/RHH family protein
MVRPTIKQQQMLAQKSRKTKSETPTEIPESSTESTNAPETSTDTLETSQKRDKQVTVKFSENDMERLKTAAGKARRPVANLIYSLTMDYVENSED